MLENTDNYVDPFGNRSVWIEIMNLGYNDVNIANCYLTNDINNPKMYRIPEGDPVTVIPKRYFMLFFADGVTQHGTQHLNFTLETKRFVALFSSDGRTLIDSVTLPNLPPNTTYCRKPDGVGNWQVSEITTPGATNDIFDNTATANETFAKLDPYGVIMTIIAMIAVFIPLWILYRIFEFIGNVNQGKFKLRRKKGAKEDSIADEEEQISGEVIAAISAAIHLFKENQHDLESEIITIKRTSKMYSPWSSKIHNLTKTPEVRRNK
jgi:Na+-transporting methylmalonyl-CoA/oxaloacetate decarboxylase gamma subunit